MKQMEKRKTNKSALILSTLVIVSDIATVLFLSVLSLSFDFSELKKVSFWLAYAATTIATIIAFYTFSYLGIKNSELLDVVAITTEELDKNRKQIEDLFLSNKLEFYIDTKNKISKATSYINLIDRRLAKKKEEREELNDLKHKVIKIRKYYQSLISKEEVLTKEELAEYEQLEIELNISSISHFHMHKINYTKISKNGVFGLYSGSNNNIIGDTNTNKIVNEKATSKIIISLVTTAVFSSIGTGLLNNNWNAVFQAIWRIFLICMNCFIGYRTGSEAVLNNKVSAMKEIIKVQNDFMNYAITFGYITK